MRQSRTPKPATGWRRLRRSATTADGIAAERLALAERALERQRRTSRARVAARRLDRQPASNAVA
jgi:hypothetical protein